MVTLGVSAGSLITMNPRYNALILLLLLGSGSVMMWPTPPPTLPPTLPSSRPPWCEYGGKTYFMGDFRPSPCTFCHCTFSGEVYCTIADCAAPHCVNPVLGPDGCCSICKDGPNCLAGSQVIPAGKHVQIDDRTVCHCTYEESRFHLWYASTDAVCEEIPTTPPTTISLLHMDEDNDEKEREAP
ncbi:hypothetical protein LDENG_00084710 [Lucifuga dentata]|nr:hypothetical protein LDENG_00084710 [Lucifuga dentata]